MLVNESIITSGLTGPQKVIQEIVTFAKAQGWTEETGGAAGLEHKKTNSIWDISSPYGWIAGDGDFYTLTSTGYGSQNLIVRLERRGSRIRIQMSSQKDYSLISTMPSRQTALLQNDDFNLTYDTDDYGLGWSINTGTANNLYLYGDVTWIMAVLDIDSIFYTHAHFGSLDPIESSPTQLECAGKMSFMVSNKTLWSEYVNYTGQVSGSSEIWAAFIANKIEPTGGNGYAFGYYYESEDKTISNNTETRYLFKFKGYDNAGYGTQGGIMGNYTYCINQNNFSGKRPMLKELYFYRRNSDSQWVPVAFSPIYIIEFNGLTPAQQLSYGTEIYRVFPVAHAAADRGGIAIRTA